MRGEKLVQRISSTRGFAKVAPRLFPPLDHAVHRLTRGRMMISDRLLPGVVLTAKGARTGRLRRTPLACMPERERGSWLLIGSNFGRPDHPAWTANLRRYPDVEICWEGEDIPVHAEELKGEERERAWARALRFWPPYAVYQERVERRIRIFRLERRRTGL